MSEKKSIKRKDIPTFLIILSIGLFVAFLANRSCDSVDSSTIDLNASVRFTGTQFVITNNDAFDYNNVELEVNDNYKLKEDYLRAGQTYTVGMMQFADKEGKRFTELQKPQKFTIWCDLDDGKKGFLYGELK